jgi:hypothetical protein
MERKLRFSERQRLTETGSLGPLLDAPSEALTNAVVNVYRRGKNSGPGQRFETAFRNNCIEHFGWTEVAGQLIDLQVGALRTEEFLDFVEILVEEGSIEYPQFSIASEWNEPAINDAEGTINSLFERHRFAYRFEQGEIRKIGSPALDEEIVGPALLAVQRPGWEEVEKSFREAIQHQRGSADENDDALTSANAAVEAAMKAAGFQGANLGPLTKEFKKSSYVPAELKGVPEALDTLIGRSGALRSSHGDAHGKASGAAPVPQALVDLAIHWAGAFIVYLGDAVSADE